MKKIYIVLTQTNTTLAKGIRLVTSFKYNHVSLSLDEGLDEMYSFGRRTPRNPFNAGFVHENFETGFYVVHKNIPCLIYELEITDKKYEKLIHILDSFKKNPRNFDFNISGLTLNAFGIKYQRRKENYFCAQFVSYVLSEAGIYKFNKDYCLLRPVDFSKLSGARLIYSGYIYEYNKNYNLNSKACKN